MGGDLNQIIFPLEHSNPSVDHSDNLMYQVQDCFLQAGLFDLRYLGPCHTWTNNQPESPIAKKLDRLLVNNNTSSSYPHAVASFLPPDLSDHAPCLLNLAFHLPKAGTYPYKFPNYLTKHPGFAQLIKDASIHAGSVCNTLAQLCWKSLLQLVRVQALQDPTSENFQAERDLNTVFFHRICQVRSSYNAIRAFLSGSDVWITDPLEMSNLAVSHFCSVLGPSLCSPVIESPQEWLQRLLNFTITPAQSSQMLLIPSAQEIKYLMFKLNPNKAPGPDGLTSGFFKAAWDSVGEEVVSAITQFFYTGFLPSATNATILTLVPKFPCLGSFSSPVFTEWGSRSSSFTGCPHVSVLC